MIYLEECDILKNAILSFSKKNKNITCILVTSSVRKEGTTSIASNLALSFAKEFHNVLLVDGNLKHSSIHKIFKTEISPGLCELADEKTTIDNALKKTEHRGLTVLPAGVPSDISSFSDYPEIKASLNKIKTSFEYVIIDSAPVNISPDALLFQSITDGVILVVHAGNTKWQVVKKAKDQLLWSRATILGVVLNRKRYFIPEFIYKRL